MAKDMVEESGQRRSVDRTVIPPQRLGQPSLDRDFLRARMNDELQTGVNDRLQIAVASLLELHVLGSQREGDQPALQGAQEFETASIAGSDSLQSGNEFRIVLFDLGQQLGMAHVQFVRESCLRSLRGGSGFLQPEFQFAGNDRGLQAPPGGGSRSSSAR